MASEVLRSRDINTEPPVSPSKANAKGSKPQLQPQTVKSGAENKPSNLSMDYHRQVLERKMAEENSYVPSFPTMAISALRTPSCSR